MSKMFTLAHIDNKGNSKGQQAVALVCLRHADLSVHINRARVHKPSQCMH